MLEVCGLFATLIGDADGVYDPQTDNDRLLLGLKGTMSIFRKSTPSCLPNGMPPACVCSGTGTPGRAP
nr:hypothetical protein [Thiocystis minor]